MIWILSFMAHFMIEMSDMTLVAVELLKEREESK
jgi:hypothetical protein